LPSGEGAAAGVGIELGGQHRRPDDALEGGGADEAMRRRRHQDSDAVVGTRGEAGELECFVGGDAAAYAEEDPRHSRASGTKPNR